MNKKPHRSGDKAGAAEAFLDKGEIIGACIYKRFLT